MGEFVAVAGGAAGTRPVGGDFSAVVLPNIEGQQGAAQVLMGPEQKLEGFGGGDGGRKSDGRIQDPGGLASFERALWRLRKHTSQAGGLAGKDVEGDTVAGNG